MIEGIKIIKQNVKGFTLIELVMVVVILGILSAFALPKFADLSDASNQAVTKGVQDAFESIAKIAHASWNIENKPATLTIQGSTFNMSAQGYPEPEPTVNGCIDLWSQVLDTSIEVVQFVAGGTPDEWSSLRIGFDCAYYNQQGTVFDGASTPFFIYAPATGTTTGFNLD